MKSLQTELPCCKHFHIVNVCSFAQDEQFDG